jgi:hypothetical protein
VDVEKPVGQALNRDLSQSGWDPDSEITRFIERRSVELKRENQRYAEEEAWREAERQEEARRQQEWQMGRLANCEHLADVFQKLADEHAAEAEKLRTHQPNGAA